jgi:hypothetical protein
VREEEDEERKIKREEEKLVFDLHHFFPLAPFFSANSANFLRLKLSLLVPLIIWTK